MPNGTFVLDETRREAGRPGTGAAQVSPAPPAPRIPGPPPRPEIEQPPGAALSPWNPRAQHRWSIDAVAGDGRRCADVTRINRVVDMSHLDRRDAAVAA